jgi:glycerol-3-phosphate dehydrogenase (NAD(P)+)
MGDLVTTCISPHSRNRYVGEQLGLGRSVDEITAEMTMVAEGVKTAVTARELAERHGVPMPVFDEIYKVVSGQNSADRAYRGLRVRPGHEAEPG